MGEQGMESRDAHENGNADRLTSPAENAAQSADVTVTPGETSRASTAAASSSNPFASSPRASAPRLDTLPPAQPGASLSPDGKLVCPWCDATNPQEALRCGACGYRFAVRCHGCGTTNPKDASVCSYCGESLRLAPFDTMEIARARAALRVRRTQGGGKGQSSGRYRRGPMPSTPKSLSRLSLVLLFTGGTALVLAILVVVLVLVASGVAL